MTLNEKRQKRAKAIADCRALIEKAEAEKRELSGEEQITYDKFWTESETLAKEIKRAEELERVEKDLSEPATRRANPDMQPVKRNDKEEAEFRNKSFEKFLRDGRGALNGDEVRALSANDPSAGGFLTAPEQFVNDLIKAVDNLVFMRQAAKVFQLNGGGSLGVPTLDNRMSAPTWTSEIGTPSEDSTMTFGKRQLKTSPLSKLIKVSKTLINRSVKPVTGIVQDELAYQFAITQENAFLNGTGADQPLGVFIASNDGISTARDISAGNTTTSIGVDGLKAAKYGLKAQYRGSAKWMFHRDGVKQISQLKDTTNNYLWQPSNQAGEPDLLLGLPIMESEYVPNTFTTGLYVGMLANWSFYWIAESLGLEIQELRELYALTNQIGYIGRLEVDGMPVLEEAFVRVKLA